MEQEQGSGAISTYVITNVTKINRKVYSIFKINIGRSIPLRSIIYFLTTLAAVFILRHIPILNYLILWVPFTIAYFGIPIGTAYLLGEVTTEGRAPLSYFRSYIQYYTRHQKGFNVYKGRPVTKPVQYQFKGLPTYQLKSINTTEIKPKTYAFKGFPTYRYREGSK